MSWIEDLKTYMRRVFVSFVGRPIRIVEIPEGSDDLGYTTDRGEIFLNFLHSLVLRLQDGVRDVFLLGVFVHEMLHQIYSDFAEIEKGLIGVSSKAERRVIRLLANILEDPAIEYRAPQVIGGSLLRALRFTIRVIYRESPPINESDSPFSELCNALIQFGDMGLVKGCFTSGAAFDCFKVIAPEFNALIKASSMAERVEAAKRWTSLTRPLWEREEDIGKTADSIEGRNRVSGYEGPESPAENTDTMSGGENGALAFDSEKTPEERRRDFYADVLKDTPEDGRDARAGGSLENGSEGGCDVLFVDEDTANELIFDEQELTAEDIKRAEEEIERAKKRQTAETPYVQDLDIPISSRIIKKATCINHRMMTGADEARIAYEKLVRKNEQYIQTLVKQFRQLFSRDEDEMARATSGELDPGRYLVATSAYVFNRRIEIEHMDDISIFLCIDESGSMWADGKINTARETAVILAEVCARLKVPLYTMGFTADTEGVAVVHDHFTTWSNTRAERYSLMSMRAKASNCDGYSIRYATALLERHRAEHKILCIISDGIPACSKYYSVKAGLADTADAIKTAKQSVSVVGLGLGDCNPGLLKRMYSGSFVYVKNRKNLTGQLVEVLKTLVKNY